MEKYCLVRGSNQPLDHKSDVIPIELIGWRDLRLRNTINIYIFFYIVLELISLLLNFFSFIFFHLISVARTCNIIFIVLDVLKPLQHKRLIEYELEGFGIRLNREPPNIGYKKKDKGGLNLTATVWDVFDMSLICLFLRQI